MMMAFANWLYYTIPFIQLFNNRFNILGFIWFISLTSLTYICLNKSKFSFEAKTKNIHSVGLLAISIFASWIFYRSLDELLTIFTVVSWDASLLSWYPESIIFWVGKILNYSIVFLGLTYLFKSLKIKIFRMKWFSSIALWFVLLVQRWSVSIFKVDYAVLLGSERITVFWKFYPILYLSYSLFYYSIIRRNVV